MKVMAIIKDIDSDFLMAMKAKNEPTLGVLRMLRSSFMYKAIEMGKKVLEENEAVAVLKSEIKKRQDSIEVYKQGNRADLADKEVIEIEILNKYLPAQMSEAEVLAKATEVVASLSDEEKGNFGLVMKKVMAELQGGADGKVISQVVKTLLQK